MQIKNEIEEVNIIGTEEAVRKTIARPLDAGPACRNKELYDLITGITESLYDLKHNCLNIGWSLRYIKQKKLYKEEGFKNIYEFAAHHFNLSQPSVSRFIKICEEFSIGDKPELMQEYAQYNLSQLIELLPMKMELREKVTPNMTITQIRALRREGEKTDLGEIPREKAEHTEVEEDRSDYDKSYSISNNRGQSISLTDKVWQPELPRFTNDEEIWAWLHDIESWGVWYADPNIHTRYYKYDFDDGSRLIIARNTDTNPAFMGEENSSYGEEGCSEDIHYHMVFSNSFLEKHQNDYLAGYKNHSIYSATSVEVIASFLNELQREGPEFVTVEETEDDSEEPCGEYAISFAKDYISNEYIVKEFDPDHLEEDELVGKTSITRKYAEFYKKHRYIPRYFNAKDILEVTDYALCLATSCGEKEGMGSIIFFYVVEEIAMVINDESLEMTEVWKIIRKLLRIAEPEERKKAEEMLNGLFQHTMQRAKQKKASVIKQIACPQADRGGR